ncbi:MAG TPA: sulfatase-like hydrolase/transferase [Planctomycetota bacterium]
MKSRILFATTMFLLGFSVLAENALPPKPNIVIILSDDMGYADVGAYGCKDIPTPNIDSLAKNGVRCTNGYVSGPYCSPTRAALMTGRYQQRYGCEYLTTWHGNPGLNLKETTVAQRLKEAGYVTGIVGKWHLGHTKGYHPLDRGFDEFYGFLGGGHHYLPLEKKGRVEEYTTPLLRNREEVDERRYLTDAFGDEAVEFVRRHAAAPFFLYLAFNAVHVPLEVTEKYTSRFPDIKDKRRRTYAAMTAAMDDAIGRVLEELRAKNLESNTLVFFLNDNGGPLEHNGVNGSRNTPLRGGKGETWEGGIRVPFIAQWKGVLPAGATYDKPVIQMDITATALEVAGLPLRPEWQLDGVNLLPFFAGQNEGTPHQALYWRLGHLMAIRAGDWKLVTPYDNEDSMGPPPEDYNFLAKARVYNLSSDISEKHELTDKHRDKFRELGELWSKWNAQSPPNAPPNGESQKLKGKRQKKED